MAATFLAAIENATTPSQVDEAFPLDVLAVTSGVSVFYDHFGISA